MQQTVVRCILYAIFRTKNLKIRNPDAPLPHKRTLDAAHHPKVNHHSSHLFDWLLKKGVLVLAHIPPTPSSSSSLSSFHCILSFFFVSHDIE
jgi:hypothetical protein